MIKSGDGRKVTPREKAREIIMDLATNITNASGDFDSMSVREAGLVVGQLEKELNWLASKWGFLEIQLYELRRTVGVPT